MEKSENKYKQAKRKAQIQSNGGGNIGGLVVAGGALAVASLVAAVAAFAVHRGRKRNGKDTSSRRPKKVDQTNQGLHFTLQNSPPTFDCNPCDEPLNKVATQIDSCELVSIQSSILEENPAPAIKNEISGNGYDRGMLFPVDSKQDSIESYDHQSGTQEVSLSMLDNIKNNSREEFPLMEVIEAIEEETKMDAMMRNSLMHSVEEERNDEMDEKVVVVEETKEEFALVESIEVIEEEEKIESVEVSAEKNSSMLSIEEEEEDDETDDKLVVVEETKEEFSLVESIEVLKEEETINSLEVSASMLSVEEQEENDEKEEKVVVVEVTKGEFSLVERIEEEETIDSVELSGDKNSSKLSAEKEEEEKESLSIKSIELWNKEGAIDDASKTSAEITSILPVVEKEVENDSNEVDGDRESATEKEEENSEITESSSAAFSAGKFLPVESVEKLSLEFKDTLQKHSAAKIVEEQQTTITEDCNHFHKGKIDMLQNCRNDHKKTQNSIFFKKEEILKFIGFTDQPMWLTKWRVWGRYVLVLALMVLLLVAHRNGLSLDLVIGRAGGLNLSKRCK